MIPAFAAIFFDLLINSYSVSIKRIGAYVGRFLEPTLKSTGRWPADVPMWEEYMRSPKRKQRYSLVGNLGITLMAAVPGIVSLFRPFRGAVSLPLLLAYIPLLAYDLEAFLRPRWVIEKIEPDASLRSRHG
jgi:hypothetical protein